MKSGSAVTSQTCPNWARPIIEKLKPYEPHYEKVRDFAKTYFYEIVSATFLLFSLSMTAIPTFVGIPIGFFAGSVLASKELLPSPVKELMDNAKLLMTIQGFCSSGTYILSGSYLLAKGSGFASGVAFGMLGARYFTELKKKESLIDESLGKINGEISKF